MCSACLVAIRKLGESTGLILSCHNGVKNNLLIKSRPGLVWSKLVTFRSLVDLMPMEIQTQYICRLNKEPTRVAPRHMQCQQHTEHLKRDLDLSGQSIAGWIVPTVAIYMGEGHLRAENCCDRIVAMIFIDLPWPTSSWGRSKFLKGPTCSILS